MPGALTSNQKRLRNEDQRDVNQHPTPRHCASISIVDAIQAAGSDDKPDQQEAIE
jgi:hypothetical protein